ncbi:MAG TPA: M13 family metallopeptidase [Candidatus Acidoferrum sp.]|jgi:endothelin-converting enzyme/putative endopeptidase
MRELGFGVMARLCATAGMAKSGEAWRVAALACVTAGIFVGAGLGVGSLRAQEKPLHGIDVSDLDRKVPPCDDFFEFANGSWRAKNPIPASMTIWSKRWAAGEATKEVLHGILEEAAANSAKAAPKSVDRLIGDYYGACMDESRINAQGVKALKREFEIIGSIGSVADLQRAITRLEEEGISTPFGFGSSQDPHHPTQVIADTAPSGLGLPDRDFYFKDDAKAKETRQKYVEHVAKMLELAGHDAKAAAAESQVVMRMETALAGASLTNVELRDPYATDHKMKLEDAQKLTPDFNWAEFFAAYHLEPGVAINVDQPKFLQEVQRQLKETSLADWKTYLTWQVLDSAAASLSAPFVQENFAFNQAYLGGTKEMKPRWKRCAESTDANLGEALGKKYVEKTFSPEAKARMQEMVKNILSALHDDIGTLTWMSDETKQKALAKLATFNPKVGYPDKWKDYSNVPITRDSYWDDVVAARRFAVRDDAELIGKPVDRGRWGMTTPTSNAYYNPLLNEIVFPAGILLPPMFDVTASDAVNYGGIGPVIGHEISHGFDDQGAQYDASGELKNWWTPEDYKRFQARGQCVVDQFSSYTVAGGLHENGKLVLGESIGDLGGVKLAYLAFQKSMEGKPRPTNQDGFTPEQQFFIAWGQARGDEIRPEAQRQFVLTNPHPVSKYRVIGPLCNMPEFRQAFDCKAGDAMVRPEGQRCSIW